MVQRFKSVRKLLANNAAGGAIRTCISRGIVYYVRTLPALYFVDPFQLIQDNRSGSSCALSFSPEIHG